MERVFFIAGAALAALGVAAGAFGAHALRGRLTADMQIVFETGVRYHLIHALGMLAVAWAAARWPGQAMNAAGWLFLTGTLLFSGSLYALSLSGVRALGGLTPLGGIAFIAGWVLLAWAVWRG
jgi:uncharacterized membrane protein YgdD (TMEM256/DUF423 family)